MNNLGEHYGNLGVVEEEKEQKYVFNQLKALFQDSAVKFQGMHDYYSKIYFKEDLTDKQLNNIRKKVEPDFTFYEEEVLGFVDDSLIGNAKSGMLFTKEGICVYGLLQRDCIYFEIINKTVYNDNDENDIKLKIYTDDEQITISSRYYSKRELNKYIERAIEILGVNNQ